MSQRVHRIQQNGWRLAVAAELAPALELTQAVLELADKECLPLRRSRHARTFLLRSASGNEDADLFVKHLDPPAGWERLKSWFRRTRLSRTERITAALSAAGFFVPPILLSGAHHQSRREVIVTLRAEGDGPILALRGLEGSIAAKRAVLCALGAEVGRLHRAGFIHGDLTPFNLRIVINEPPRFAFIDNERTCRNPAIARRRRRLRNLVQLGHFALPGITRADRMRVFRAYESALYGRHSRSLERKAVAMLRRRAERALNS
ncbi:MAG: hypothetical protein JOZ29_03825 [Deltaproteobacteria bacterium]|nr:hypothetical protein [Deltaproteobacteria bacterium]